MSACVTTTNCRFRLPNKPERGHFKAVIFCVSFGEKSPQHTHPHTRTLIRAPAWRCAGPTLRTHTHTNTPPQKNTQQHEIGYCACACFGVCAGSGVWTIKSVENCLPFPDRLASTTPTTAVRLENDYASTIGQMDFQWMCHITASPLPNAIS